MIAINLSKQQALDAYPRAIQQIIKEAIETVLEFLKGNVKVL